jgi:SAM-dependent methyltransferase
VGSQCAFVEQHWRKIGLRAVEDFRTVALTSKVLKLLGPDPGLILDVGCGAGVFVALAHRRGFSVLGIDPSAEQVGNAHSILESIGLPLELVRCCAVEDLAKEGAKFDSCGALDVLEHLETPAIFLQAIREVLKTDGRLVVSVPARPELYSERDAVSGHYRRYDPDTLRQHLHEGGFEVAHLQYWNWLGWVQTVWRRKILLKDVDYYDFRYSDSSKARVMNVLLRAYFSLVENRGRPPVGLSLLAIARPRSGDG